MEEDAPNLNSLKTDKDKFDTLYDVSCAMVDEGMERCGLIFGRSRSRAEYVTL